MRLKIGGEIVETIKWLSVTDRHTEMYLDKRLEPLGLNSSQHMFVLMICEEPGLSQEKMFSSFYLHPSNITRAIAALEKQGFLIRQPNPADKRTCCLIPTDKAKETYPKIKEIVQSWYDIVLEGFTVEEKRLLDRLVRRTGQALLDIMREEARENKF